MIALLLFSYSWSFAFMHIKTVYSWFTTINFLLYYGLQMLIVVVLDKDWLEVPAAITSPFFNMMLLSIKQTRDSKTVYTCVYVYLVQIAIFCLLLVYL